MSHRTSEGLGLGFPIAQARDLGHGISNTPPPGDGVDLGDLQVGDPIVIYPNGDALIFLGNDEFGKPKTKIVSNFTGQTSGGGGGFPPQTLAAQQAADIAAMERLEAQLQADKDEADANRDFVRSERIAQDLADVKAAKLAAENALKLTLISEGGALTRTLADIQSRARDLKAELFGKNPFRGAIRQAGGVPRFTDPFQAFMAENQSVIDRQAPTINPNETSTQIQADINRFDLGTPSSGNIIGLAHGGEVGVGETVRVGELGTELVQNMGGGRVKVIPENELGGSRVVGSAPHGGEFEFDADAEFNFDRESIEQVLGPVFAHLGFSEAPTSKRTSLENVRRLGIQPRLVRRPDGAIFFIDQDGFRHHIRNLQEFREFGFSMGDVVNVNEGDIGGAFPAGGPLTSAPPLIEKFRPFAPQAVPLRVPKELGGFRLPAPRTFANLFRGFTGANRRIILGALGVSELQAEEALDEIRAFTPHGTAGARVAFA